MGVLRCFSSADVPIRSAKALDRELSGGHPLSRTVLNSRSLLPKLKRIEKSHRQFLVSICALHRVLMLRSGNKLVVNTLFDDKPSHPNDVLRRLDMKELCGITAERYGLVTYDLKIPRRIQFQPPSRNIRKIFDRD